MSDRRIRAISWWLTWPDLMWPDSRVKEHVLKRADEAAGNGVNMAVIFGAHFRWDFMPLWGRLHSLLAFIAETLHARDIRLFDHHSSVLTTRPRNDREAAEVFLKNRHQVPFYPDAESAALWSYNGDRLNEWRMINLVTGQPDFIPAYTAEQFCMNNPGFRAGYAAYLQRLTTDCPLDGLMSDDAVFDHAWETCGCDWCRAEFREKWGHDIPPVDDVSFWGNRSSRAFRDYIRFRFTTTSEFLGHVRASLPKQVELMTCCNSSVGTYCMAAGMSYQDFIDHSDYVLLEMCGNVPDQHGKWDVQGASQALHMAIAREHGRSSIGLGYGFTPDSADFIWALNRFLGSHPWVSTLKGRLAPGAEEDAFLRDDAELVGHAYRWEQAHENLFRGEPIAEVAVFFSRTTRDACAQAEADYVDDFRCTCSFLSDKNIPHVVVTRIPRMAKYPVLVLSSVLSLSRGEDEDLQTYLEEGGTVIATGPLGLRDENATDRGRPFMACMGIECWMDDPPREAGFPPSQNWECPAPPCHGAFQGEDLSPTEWVRMKVGAGRLSWAPGRMQTSADELAVSEHILTLVPRILWLDEAARGWRIRVVKDGKRYLIHGLAIQVEAEYDDRHTSRFSPHTRVMSTTRRSPETGGFVTLHACRPIRSAILHSIDLDEPKTVVIEMPAQAITLDLSDIRYHFILEATLE